MRLQDVLPRAFMYYGKMQINGQETGSEELGIFLPLRHFGDAMERNIEQADGIALGFREFIIHHQNIRCPKLLQQFRCNHALDSVRIITRLKRICKQDIPGKKNRRTAIRFRLTARFRFFGHFRGFRSLLRLRGLHRGLILLPGRRTIRSAIRPRMLRVLTRYHSCRLFARHLYFRRAPFRPRHGSNTSCHHDNRQHIQ